MALSDFLTTDPIIKRARRLRGIEREQIKLHGEIKAMRKRAWALKREYDNLRLEIKALKKGYEADELKQLVRLK